MFCRRPVMASLLVTIVVALALVPAHNGAVAAQEAIDKGTGGPFAGAVVAEYQAHHRWITGFQLWNIERAGTRWSYGEGCLARFAAASVR